MWKKMNIFKTHLTAHLFNQGFNFHMYLCFELYVNVFLFVLLLHSGSCIKTIDKWMLSFAEIYKMHNTKKKKKKKE